MTNERNEKTHVRFVCLSACSTSVQYFNSHRGHKQPFTDISNTKPQFVMMESAGLTGKKKQKIKTNTVGTSTCTLIWIFLYSALTDRAQQMPLCTRERGF